jgi:hypothetical protein
MRLNRYYFLFFVLIVYRCSAVNTNPIITPLPGELFTSDIPMEDSQYPVNYKARLLDDGRVELQRENPTAEVNSIIHLSRIFKLSEYCIMPERERPGEWQNFTVTSINFWLEFNLQTMRPE